MAQEQQTPAAAKVENPNIEVVGAAGQPADAAPSEQPKATLEPSSLPGGYFWGTGRRKSAIARVRVRPGAGKIEVNGRAVDDFFHEPKDRNAVVAPLQAAGAEGKLDVFANVRGGGFTGQAGAILLGLSRALVKVDSAYEQMLRDAGYLTRDGRMKERKKYGQRGARRRFQFSKR